jgi:hypothetical protein
MNRRNALATFGLSALLLALPLTAEAGFNNFTGTWNTQANGAAWTMTLVQSGGFVSGTYNNPTYGTGTIHGSVKGRTLRFKWNQELNDGSTYGHGRFAISADGKTFSGTFESDDPDFNAGDEFKQGSWTGTRS